MAKRTKYIYSVGILDADGNEIDEVHITACSEEEMWKIFDEEYDSEGAVIYGCDLA